MLAMDAIADEGVDRGVSDTMIAAGVVETGEGVSGDAFGSTTWALELAPGTRRWRCRYRLGARAPTSGTIVGWARFEQAVVDQLGR